MFYKLTTNFPDSVMRVVRRADDSSLRFNDPTLDHLGTYHRSTPSAFHCLRMGFTHTNPNRFKSYLALNALTVAGSSDAQPPNMQSTDVMILHRHLLMERGEDITSLNGTSCAADAMRFHSGIQQH